MYIPRTRTLRQAHRSRSQEVRLTRGISCEAVRGSRDPRAQDGTSACPTGAVLSFVCFIPLFDGLSVFPPAGPSQHSISDPDEP
jgi:hypothetical protein